MVKPIISFGPQPKQPNEGLSSNKSILGIGTGVGAGALSGFIPYKKGRLWDKYISGIRAVETGFPSAILRTFRTSEFLSPLESYSSLAVPKQTVSESGIYGSFLRQTFGPSKSYNLVKSGRVFGDVLDASGNVVGVGLNVKAGTQKGAAIADYYARVTGAQLSKHDSLNDALMRSYWRLSKSELKFHEWIKELEPSLRQQRLILGAKLRSKINILGKDIALTQKMSRGLAYLETTSNYLRAKQATTFGRLNTLLTKPLELPIIGPAISKIPGIRSMAVRPGTSMQMLGRLTGKAMLAGAAWKGLEYLDYLRSEDSPWASIFGTAAGAGIGAMIARKPGMMFSKRGLIAGAAIGLMTGIAPRFDKGIFHGAATLFTDANLARTEISKKTGLTESLQNQQRITPDFVSLQTALGFGGVGALGLGTADYFKYLASTIAKRPAGQTLSEAFELGREARAGKLASKIFDSGFGRALGKVPLLKGLTKIKSPMALGFLGGLAAWQVAATGLSLASGNFLASIPGLSLLGSQEEPEELKDIYSGKKEVAVRKGRWWEFGRSSKYEGGRIQYYRPHFLKRLEARSYQKGLYGDEAERWKYDPLLHPYKALFGSDDFKYHYEQKYQYERPAPLTSTYGEDIPFIGPLVAATIGKIFKPRKEIRPDEWKVDGGYKDITDIRGETEPSYDLGGKGSGAPVYPEEGSQILNELNYRRREAVGLPGFTEGAIYKALTGKEEVFSNKRTIGTMGKETGSEYWLWKHLNLGGGLASTEPIRRFIPRTRSYLEEYNPLTNTMPSWLPDDYFLDLKHGNPFDKIPEAEIRLPGRGYASLHPEVEGLSPEEYPLAHRVKILGDIAMWSSEYRKTLSYAKRNIKSMTSKERSIIETTEMQVREKKKSREFAPYVFNKNNLEMLDVNVSEIISPRRIRTEEFGDVALEIQGIGKVKDKDKAMEFLKSLEGSKITIATPKMESRRYDKIASGARMKVAPIIGDRDISSIMAEQGLITQKPLKDEFKQLEFSKRERIVGSIGETLMHGIETPLEYLTPMSPASKLIRKRSPIEEYVASEAIGTSNAFWDKPIENFIKPAFDMLRYKAGYKEIPENIQERRDIQEYFDMLRWTKMARLEAKARQEGDRTVAADYKRKKEKTLFGTDVFKSPMAIMRALPRRERDFYNEFVNAKSEKERAQILELIPENEKRIYTSQWMRQKEQAARAKQSAKLNTEEDDKNIALTSKMRKSEGFEYSEDMEAQWLKETGGKIPFDEWIREKKAAEYFSTRSLPGAEWIGWNPAVDLDDIKMVTVEMAGLDHHDFDLWGQRKRALARKPYINTDTIEQMAAGTKYQDSWQVAKNSTALAKMYNDKHAEVQTHKIDADIGNNTYNINIKDGRRGLIESAFKKLGA